MTFKLPEGWEKVKLGDICIEESGSYGINESAVEYSGDLYRYLRITDITDDGKIDESKKTSVNIPKGIESKYLLKKNDIVFARTGASAGRNYFYSGKEEDMIYAGFLIKFSLDENKVLPEYIKYYCLSKSYKDWVQSISTGSTRPNINAKMYKNMEIVLPDSEHQKLLVNTLSVLDDKIELNNKINENLEAQAQAIFKHWFVDFEFPDENGMPYKSSGGEMVESELGLIPEGWEVRTLGDFFPVVTGKKNANIATDNGELPFFTCSQGIFYTDDYSFDANAILLAGNGDFNVKRYNGKFEAYQRTYVLIPYDEKYVGLLYNLIKFYLPQIVSGHKGSVINYITKGMIEEFKFAVPNDMPEKILKLFNDYENFIAHLKKEVKNLEIIRDTLLPKLMSGEIRVGEDDIEVVENPL